MNDILFIYPKHNDICYPPLFPPTCFLFLIPFLEKEGFECKILDQRVDKYFYKNLYYELNKNPIAVGVHCMGGEQIKLALEVTRYIKEKKSGIPVIWGGSHPTMFPEVTIKEKTIDIIVRGKAEGTIVALMNALKRNLPLRRVAGISYKEEGDIIHQKDAPILNMEEYPMPAWYHMKGVIEPYLNKNENNYLHKDRLTLFSSRGCPYQCTFCTQNGKWRGKTATQLIEEIEYLANNFNINKFFFADDYFNFDKKRVDLLGRYMRERNFLWGFDTRINDLDTIEKTEYYKSLNVDCFYIGVESGSNRILKKIKKRLKKAQIIKAAKSLAKSNIVPWYSFVFGFPSENIWDIIQTFETAATIKIIAPNATFEFSYCTAYPGTEITREFQDRINFKWPESLKDFEDHKMLNPTIHSSLVRFYAKLWGKYINGNMPLKKTSMFYEIIATNFKSIYPRVS